MECRTAGCEAEAATYVRAGRELSTGYCATCRRRQGLAAQRRQGGTAESNRRLSERLGRALGQDEYGVVGVDARGRRTLEHWRRVRCECAGCACHGSGQVRGEGVGYPSVGVSREE